MKSKTNGEASLWQRLKSNEILFLGLTLFLICAIAGLLLGVTYENTRDKIEAKKDAVTKAAYQKVLPIGDAALTETALPEEYQGGVQEVFRAEGVGYAIRAIGKGYAGDDIELAVGISEEGNIVGVTIISHSETPGLGAKASEPEFLSQFSGCSTTQTLTVVKNGAAGAGEIDAVSGATKTSVGVTAAVNEVCRFYNEYLQGGEKND